MTRHATPLLALLLCASTAVADEPADLVLQGGVVHTLDPARPRAGAVAVRGDRIVGVADAVPEGWIGPGTRVIDLRGACVVPGLWDAHGHLLSLGLGELEVDLSGTRSFAEVVERVAARAREMPTGAWIVGRGWDQNDWPREEFGGEFPTHDRLSAAVPDHAVILSRVDGHAALLNARGLAAHGIDAATPTPEGGDIPRDGQGRPTGVLVDAALSLAPEPAATPEQVRAALRSAARTCASYGLVGVHDAGVGAGTLAALEELYGRGELPLRVYAMLSSDAAPELMKRGPQVGRFGGRLTVRSVKYFVDGALGSRGAWLLEPYADKPETRGLPQLDGKALTGRVAFATSQGFQVCVHAIGDAGVRAVLDAVESVGGARALRPRVEHAQVIHEDDLARFARLGVVPSMQPTHATSDMPWAEARLGAERVKGAYAWRRLLDAGVPAIACGSDFPVEGVSPLWGLYAAVTRLDPEGGSPHGPGGWFPDQRLTRPEALLGFTRWAAYAAFLEDETAVIAPGRWADLAVFDADLLTCAPGALRELKARLTVLAGKVVHEAPR